MILLKKFPGESGMAVVETDPQSCDIASNLKGDEICSSDTKSCQRGCDEDGC